MIENGERQKNLALPLASGLSVLYGISIMEIERYEKEISQNHSSDDYNI